MGVMVFLSHEVKDFATWRQGFDAHKPARDAAGFTDGTVGRDATKPNLVHLSFRSPSLEAAQAFIGNPELGEKMASLGVIGRPEVRIAVPA